MAAVHDVPDVTGEKMAVGARHRLVLRAPVSSKKTSAKLLSRAFYAILCRLINTLRWSDPALQ
jgi:hypothetical protein